MMHPEQSAPSLIAQWLNSQGIDVVLLESSMDEAFVGVVAGGAKHCALYDPEKIIHLLIKKGMSRAHATSMFDTHYYPLSESGNGPCFLLQFKPFMIPCQHPCLQHDTAPTPT